MDVGRGPDPNTILFSKIGLATERLRAIDLSCRACGAGAGRWAWIVGWGTFGVHPNLRFQRCKILSPEIRLQPNASPVSIQQASVASPSVALCAWDALGERKTSVMLQINMAHSAGMT